jgi:drug/metabolite transporter (DMT)-like permease
LREPGQVLVRTHQQDRPVLSPLSTGLLTALTLAAFAGNSILCRVALVEGAIDPVGFTALRIGSGALVLLPLAGLRGASGARWRAVPALALFAYAIGFSLAYVTLNAGTGALLLFGFVQVTMLGAGWVRGERPSLTQTLGLLAALAGMGWLVSPGVTAPDPVGAALMSAAGIAWGVYSLLGRGAGSPTRATARNFLLAAPLGLGALLLAGERVSITPRGALLAVASGALTSGLGYVLWYAALRGHTRISAAVVQLAVPVLAALGGVALLSEAPTWRLAGSSVLTLGGVGLALVPRRRARP